MGKKSPPPAPAPVIIKNPPPPPATLYQDVTPQATYQDATDYLARMHAREEAIEKRRWDAGETPGNVRASHAGINLASAELANKLDQSSSFPGTPAFGGERFGGGTDAVISALAAKPVSGSTSRDARIRPSQLSETAQGTALTGPERRLQKAQKAYYLASQAKDSEEFSYPDFVKPSWHDRDWYPVMEKWKERDIPVEVNDDDPEIIKIA